MNIPIDKFLITIMDRLVWFILSLVISHLFTELTIARTYNSNLLQVNESVYTSAIELWNPSQRLNQNLDIRVLEEGNNSHFNKEEENMFSLRPLMDSIFDISLSALNATNNLLQRLTGRLTDEFQEKSLFNKIAP